MSISQNDKTIYLKKALKKTPYLQESQGQILDSLKESPIQKECDALKQVILSNRKNTTYAVAYK